LLNVKQWHGSNRKSGLKPLKRIKGLYPKTKALGVYALTNLRKKAI